MASLLTASSLAGQCLASGFGLTFKWGDIPLCTSGNPNRVENPSFTLSNVPQGTAEIRFRLQDLNVPSFDHGGGTVAYTGQDVVKPGAFRYRSPCPPGGRHLYEWTATALDGYGSELGKARARKEYP
ncbi:MAG: hypothetical protein WB783_15630 [Arenicellales bacterium]